MRIVKQVTTKYVVRSATGRSLGAYDTKRQADVRMAKLKAHRHGKKSP